TVVDLPPPPPPLLVAPPAALPTKAEKAVVENAGMLNQVTHPKGSTVRPEDMKGMQDLLKVDRALIRPLPESYLTVKKEKGEENVDARLTSARYALQREDNA